MGGRDKRLQKSSLKFEAASEIAEAIAIIFAEVTDSNEVVDNIADIFPSLKAPQIKDGQSHGTKLIQPMAQHPLQHFLSGDVLIFLTVTEHLHGNMERIPNKAIRGRLVAGISLHSAVNSFFKGNRDHGNL